MDDMALREGAIMQEQITIEGMKSQAKALRGYLNEQDVDLSHSKSLEAVARSHDFKDWNTASALVQQAEKFWEDEYQKVEALRNKEEADIEELHKNKVYRGIYATKELIVYCGWQKLGNSIKVPGHSSAILKVIPTVSPYFEPRAIRLIGSALASPSTNRRFIVGAITVGGSPQLAINKIHPIESFEEGLLSDVFNRSYDPLLLNWSVFSTLKLARELEIHIYNLNEEEILVSACLWGNAVSSLECYV